MRTFIVTVVTMALAGIAVAGEKRVTESDMPAPVLAAVAKKYPAAKKVGFAKEVEQQQTTFEVSITDGAKKIDIDLSPDGKILAEEQLIPVQEVPASVRKALAESPRYRAWRVQRAERIITRENDAAPSYELVVARGQKKAEVVFDQDGKLVKQETRGATESD